MSSDNRNLPKVPNLGDKPTESSLLPKPWIETTTEIISPLIWLGKITRNEATVLGFVLWFVPAIILMYIYWNEPDQVLGAVVMVWVLAALYASFLHRINFDIKEGW